MYGYIQAVPVIQYQRPQEKFWHFIYCVRRCMTAGFCHSVNEIFALMDVMQCWLLVTDVLGQPIGPIKGQTVQEERLLAPWRFDWLFRNISNYAPINAVYHHTRSKISYDFLTCRSIISFNSLTVKRTPLQSFKIVVSYLQPVMV